jgi:hypothetical protein
VNESSEHGQRRSAPRRAEFDRIGVMTVRRTAQIDALMVREGE